MPPRAQPCQIASCHSSSRKTKRASRSLRMPNSLKYDPFVSLSAWETVLLEEVLRVAGIFPELTKPGSYARPAYRNDTRAHLYMLCIDVHDPGVAWSVHGSHRHPLQNHTRVQIPVSTQVSEALKQGAVHEAGSEGWSFWDPRAVGCQI